MVPACPEKAKWKGLCGKCYHQAKTLVEQEKTTWEELAEMDLAYLEEKRLLIAFFQKKGQPVPPEAGKAAS